MRIHGCGSSNFARWRTLMPDETAGTKPRRIRTRIMRWIYWKLDNFRCELNMWLDEHDLCEVCRDEPAANECIGCGQRVGFECNSFYYEDETLCTECRATITPEEEAQD